MAGRWENQSEAIWQEMKGKEEQKQKSETGQVRRLIRTASAKFNKMLWQHSGSTDDLWGEEVHGFAEMVENSPLNALPAFQSRRIHEIRARFFNLTNGDDAATDFRCMFLKLDDSEEEGPFDLAFSTGRVSPFFDLNSLTRFVTAIEGDILDDWVEDNLEQLHAFIDGVRKAPDSWTSLVYHNHCTFSTTDENEKKTYIRFRLVGGDDTKYRLDSQEQRTVRTLSRPDVELPANTYLHDKLSKLSHTYAWMKLQVQLIKADNKTEVTQVLDPCIAWSEVDHPWQNVAEVLLTHRVPKKSFERAKFNFTRTSSLQIETLADFESMGELTNIREKMLSGNLRLRRPETPLHSPEMTTLLVHAETGNYLFSGTDAGVYITVFGTKGRTEKALLCHMLKNDFERGTKDSYYIDVPVIGDIKYVKLQLIGGKLTIGDRDWNLRNLVIFDLKAHKMVEIPGYRWVSDKITLMTGAAVLAADVTDVELYKHRKLYIQEQMELLPWAFDEGLPSRIGVKSYKDLPRDYRFASEREWEKKRIITEALLKLKIHGYSTMFQSFDSFEDFKALTETINQSETAKLVNADDRWMTDEEFGREFLAGLNPVLISRLQKPLDKMPVSDDDVKGLLDRGRSLADEIKDGNVYYIDYNMFKGIGRRGGDNPTRFLANPIVLFYVRKSGELVPIAIQLEQEPGEDNPIWTPNDDHLEWLMAKTWVKSADAHVHSIYTHLTRGHLIAEPMSIAMFRQLPANHPVFKLLVPHVKYTIAVNTTGRGVLLQGEDSIFYKLLSISGNELAFAGSMYSNFNISEINIVKDLESRGVNDASKLPKYWYRDDALMLWGAIHTYVTKLTAIYYQTDQDCVNDCELQRMIKDIHDNGLRNWSGKPNGIPAKFKTIKQLNEFLATFIYNSSCFHAAVNFGQLDYYMFGPNYPGALRQPPPTKKGTVTMEKMIETLPTKAGQSLAIAFAHFLSEYASNEVYLGNYPDAHFTDQPAREVQRMFKEELLEISKKIKERNKTLDIPYVYLLPENVPNSVAQ